MADNDDPPPTLASWTSMGGEPAPPTLASSSSIGGEPTPATPASGLPQLTGFTMLALLGRGGMGAVYKARQLSLDRIVALKLMKEELSEERTFVQRFLQEARHAGQLRHENLVSALDCGEVDGRFFIVMEYIEGKSLGAILKARKRLPEREALGIVRQAARGLDYAASHRIIHRDIKPENLMIAADGTVKICDLGLSRRLDDSPHLTMTGVVACTAAYASPEQARAEKDIDPRTDIYSLGVTLYHLVTGEPPFRGASAALVLARHLTEAPRPPSAIEPSVTEPVSRLILRMMEKKRQDRFASHGDVVRAIDQILAVAKAAPAPAPKETTTPAAGPPRTRRFRVPRKSNTPLVMGGIAAAVVLLILVALTGTQDTPIPSSKTRPPTPVARWDSPAPAPAPVPPPAVRPAENPSTPTSAPPSYAAELAELDALVVGFVLTDDFANATRTLQSAMLRHLESGWAQDLDSRSRKLAETQRTRFAALRDQALQEHRAGRPTAAGAIAAKIHTWGNPSLDAELRAALKSTSIPPHPPPPRRPDAVDLLARITLPADVVKGIWTREPGALRCEAEAWSRIQLQYPAPAEYDLLAVVERVQGDNCFDLGLVMGSRQFVVEFDGRPSGDYAGIGTIDDKYAHENLTTRKGRVLVQGRPVVIDVAVRKASISVSVDGQPFLQWEGRPEQLTLHPGWAVRQSNSLFLGAFASHRIRRLELLPLKTSIAKPAAPVKAPAKAPEPPMAPEKPSAPSDADRRKADAELAPMVKARLGSGDRAARSAMAQQFLLLGKERKGDAAMRYACLDKAREAALTSMDLATALAAVEEMADQFALKLPSTEWRDPLNAHRAEALIEARKKIGDLTREEDDAAIRTAFMALAEAARAKEDFADAILAISQAVKNTALRGFQVRAAELMSDLMALKQEQLEFRKAEAADPDDPAANGTKGRYLLFVRHDEDAGLAALAKGSDGELKDLAAKELVKPSGSEDAAKIAEGWIAQIKNGKTLDKRRCQERALRWLDLAIKTADGVAKAKLQVRASQIEQLDPALKGMVTEGLVGWWKFDEGYGDRIVDSSHLKNHGARSGPPSWSNGKVLGSMKFSGTNTSFAASPAPYKAVVDNFTMAVWVKPGPVEAYAIYPWQGQGVWGGATDAGAGLVVGPAGARIVEHAPVYGRGDAVVEAAVKDWTHFTIVYEKKVPRLYVGGKLAKTGIPSEKTVHPSAFAGPPGPFLNNPFTGELDDFRIYDRVLNDNEIRAIATMTR